VIGLCFLPVEVGERNGLALQIREE